jgi:hypothetical protein
MASLGGFDDRLKASRIAQCDVCEHLAVELDACLLQTAHQLRVAHAHEASPRVDARDPKSAVVATALTTAAVSSCPSVPDLLDRIAELTATREVKALGMLENTVAATAGFETSFSARHGNVSFFFV